MPNHGQEFSTPAWAPWLAGDREVLEKVQEKAVKMVAGLKGRTYEERCAELGLESLQERRISQDMALVHKYMAKQDRTLFIRSVGNGGARTRTTAGVDGLAVQFARTDVRKNSFPVRAREQWNSLPNSLRAERQPESFKKRLKAVKVSN